MNHDNQTDRLSDGELVHWDLRWTILGILFVDLVVAGVIYLWWTMP